MEKDSREPAAGSSELLSAGWFDPIEVAIRERVRGFIETWWQRSWTRRSVARATSALGRPMR